MFKTKKTQQKREEEVKERKKKLNNLLLSSYNPSEGDPVTFKLKLGDGKESAVKKGTIKECDKDTGSLLIESFEVKDGEINDGSCSIVIVSIRDEKIGIDFDGKEEDGQE